MGMSSEAGSTGDHSGFVAGRSDRPTPESLKNVHETAADVARMNALDALLKTAKDRNPDSTLVRILSVGLAEIRKDDRRLAAEQAARTYNGAQERNAMDNLRMRVDLLIEEVTDQDSLIATAKKQLERARLNAHLVGLENRPAEYERQIAEFEALKADVEALGGPEAVRAILAVE